VPDVAAGGGENLRFHGAWLTGRGSRGRGSPRSGRGSLAAAHVFLEHEDDHGSNGKDGGLASISLTRAGGGPREGGIEIGWRGGHGSGDGLAGDGRGREILLCKPASGAVAREGRGRESRESNGLPLC
jgi:hypothetical protein